ncbi:unnamed protein product, partial [Brassica rapa subsp. narinosa]
MVKATAKAKCKNSKGGVSDNQPQSEASSSTASTVKKSVMSTRCASRQARKRRQLIRAAKRGDRPDNVSTSNATHVADPVYVTEPILYEQVTPMIHRQTVSDDAKKARALRVRKKVCKLQLQTNKDVASTSGTRRRGHSKRPPVSNWDLVTCPDCHAYV